MIPEKTIDWPWVKEELSRMEGIKPSGAGPAGEEILACLDECLLKAGSSAKPAVISQKAKIARVNNGSVELAGSKTFSSRTLASHIKGATDVCIFLVTIGSAVENAASSLMDEGESLKGYLMDRIGSLAVESMAMDAEKKTRETYKKSSESVSMRFSPGYCDWPIEEQYILADILDFSKAGVRLNEKCMMMPRKSISAVVAIGPEGLFRGKKSQCMICNKKEECYFRR